MATGTLRVVLLWHMHQPYYKDLVTGEYRLPWVRLHAMKDYYGMVKILDEFPKVHQNFNIVPSMVAQIEDYSSGLFRDPFFEVAAKPAEQLGAAEKRFALTYLFHAHPEQMIGRYPRYRQLWEQVRAAGPEPTRAEITFLDRDYRDLQVLSQLAWFDEFYLSDPELIALIEKGENFSIEDQKLVIRKEQEIVKAVLPAYRAAAQRGSVELSVTPYYHPILPLLCDTNEGAVSSPGLPLPSTRFQHPEDAEEQIRRALELHKQTFGVCPNGMWPSEGSVSEEVFSIASRLGVRWMATDEGVLGRSLGFEFTRGPQSELTPDSAEQLYKVYRFENDLATMNLVFRDHHLSDLIGFVYAGSPAEEAANHLLGSIKRNAAPLLSRGKDAVVPIILDGENAWETYPKSGREFLRRFYSLLSDDPQVEAVTIAEAIERTKPEVIGRLRKLVPGSWINANFNVWIGAPEDNKAWDYLSEARDFYEANADHAEPEHRKLAFEELLIAEGSDWNWWYGPEHHSANDRDFDELYRKHLSNVYQALGGVPPESLARPISAGTSKPTFVSQSAYIHPRIRGEVTSYFDWMGAASYSSDRRGGSMHGKQFILETIYAGINEENVYGRLDFASLLPDGPTQIIVSFGIRVDAQTDPKTFRLRASLKDGKLQEWAFTANGDKAPLASPRDGNGCQVELGKIFEFKVPLSLLLAKQGSTINLRFALYRSNLPIDALPLEGSVDLSVEPEEVLFSNEYVKA
ncbi:MAG TPA: glycoside hydrolase family 57 protein [Candidatus Acidoferrales bacterium]|nr:glycoside hydrolase family 57 protein [Candidatus Acidoferrales bacterium]